MVFMQLTKLFSLQRVIKVYIKAKMIVCGVYFVILGIIILVDCWKIVVSECSFVSGTVL